jgi:iron complex outermembrane receptor protein
MKFKKTRLASAISIATLPLLGGVPVTSFAEQQVLEEVIVTGSRRSGDIQSTPINISALGGEQIEDLRLVGISEIANYVPGLTVLDRGPRDSAPDILVRGLNTSGLGPGFTSDTIATYFSELPLTLDIKPVDMERVEVLIGPQGTLYGQGTMGGAIRYIPVKADTSEFAITARGDLSQNTESEDLGYEAGVTINVPLILDTLALRVNIDKLDDPGFIDYGFLVQQIGVSNPQPDFTNPADVAANLRSKDDLNGEDTISTRVNLRWLATDWLEANLWYYNQDTEAEGRQIANRKAFNTGRYESGLRVEEPNNYENELVSLELTADLGFAEATFVYGETTYEEVGQRDQTDLLLGFEYGYEFFPSFTAFTRETVDEEVDTVELRLASQYDSDFSWVAGYFRNELDSFSESREFTPGFDQYAVDNFGGVALRPDSLEYIERTIQNETETAFYGEVSYQINEQFAVTVGYRDYEFDVDSAGGFGLPLADTVFGGDSPDAINVTLAPNQGTDTGDLWKFNASWDVNPDTLLYFTYSEGYRNGGINAVPECTTAQIASAAQQLCALSTEILIQPDEIENYEVGYKGYLADRTISGAVALYYIDWTDLQVSTVTVNGNLPIVGNGSEAVTQGLEMQGRWLINESWEMSATYAYTNAELTARAPGLVGPFDALDGARLPGHAEHQGSINVTYSTEVWRGIALDVNYGLVYSSDIYNITGGDEDPLVDATAADAPGDRGGEAIPSYDVHHISATFRRDEWTLQAYVDNVWDEYQVTGTRTSRRFLADERNGPGTAINGFTQRSYGQYIGSPRTMGVKVKYDF